MKPVGYYALKEAGARATILGFECPRCHRQLFVTEDLPSPTADILAEMDTQE